MHISQMTCARTAWSPSIVEALSVIVTTLFTAHQILFVIISNISILQCLQCPLQILHSNHIFPKQFLSSHLWIQKLIWLIQLIILPLNKLWSLLFQLLLHLLCLPLPSLLLFLVTGLMVDFSVYPLIKIGNFYKVYLIIVMDIAEKLFKLCTVVWKKYRWEMFCIITLAILIYAYFYGGRNLSYQYKGVSLSKSGKRTPVKKKHERECQRILQDIFQRPFISVRPDFLKSPSTGRNLELDLYNQGLNLALEYNGVQHRKYSPFFHRKYEDFLSQQDRDQFKRQRCKDLKIDLIEVPDTVKYEDLEDYIRQELVKLGRPITPSVRKEIKDFTEISLIPDPVVVLENENQSIKYADSAESKTESVDTSIY
jgi:hypothetical protein